MNATDDFPMDEGGGLKPPPTTAALLDISLATQDRHERAMVDAQTCLEVFRSNWRQALNIMEGSGTAGVNEDDLEPAFAYLGQMMTLLGEERPQDDGQPGPILAFACQADIFARMLSWATDSCLGNGRLVERIKLQLLALFELLVMNPSRQGLLFSRPVLDPMVRLLKLCGMRSSVMVERRLALLLHHLCVLMTQRMEQFQQEGVCEEAPFVIISLLIPFVHRDGEIGEMARDSLLLIMALSARNYRVGEYIAVSSDFCPVLATGLSALFSSLPRRLNLPNEDCFQLLESEAMQIPNLLVFLDALEFCDTVVEVSHPMVKENLLHFVYSGFLMPVMGSALHQNSIEETIAATLYLDLFLRRLAQGSMLRIFLKFVVNGSHEHYLVLDSLIARINAGTKLSLVTLNLFQTILDFHVEDVMFHLIFRYLIPLNHLMWSQRRSLCDVEAFGRSVERFLCLVPSACLPEAALQVPLLVSAATAASPMSAPAGPPLGVTAQRRPSAMGPAAAAQQLAMMSSSYEEYLQAAAGAIGTREIACLDWNFPYDGSLPPSNVFRRYDEETALASTGRSTFSRLLQRSISGGSRPCRATARGGDPRLGPARPTSLALRESCSPAGLICSPEFSQMRVIYQLSFSEEDIDEAPFAADARVLNGAGPDPGLGPEGDAGGEPAPEETLLERVVRVALGDDFDSFILALDEVDTPPDSPEHRPVAPGPGPDRVARLLDALTDGDGDIDGPDDDDERGEPAPGEGLRPELPGAPRSVNLPELSTPERPSIGPFLTALLNRLEAAPSSCLAVNLVVTGILSSLAAYPQPLLRAFLLNTSLVLQPSVRSLYQVLFALRHRIDCFSYSVARFESHLVQAREALRRRMEGGGCPGTLPSATFFPGTLRTTTRDDDDEDSVQSGCSGSVPSRRLSAGTRAAFFDIFSRRRRRQRMLTNAFEESYLASLKLKNMVYCAIVVEEFCKELAALCQEHSVRP